MNIIIAILKPTGARLHVNKLALRTVSPLYPWVPTCRYL